MGMAQIVLLVIGSIILVLGYILPVRKETGEDKVSQINKEQIKEAIGRELEKEIEDAKKNIRDIVDETITYSIEKTERSMERLTNEKIMAVSEYSDHVLETINKNHNEVIFLYDMLNDKHESLVNTVSQAGKVKKELQQTTVVKETETAKDKAAPAEPLKRENEELKEAAFKETEFVPISPEKVEVKKSGRRKAAAEKTKVIGSRTEDKGPAEENTAAPEGEKNRNNNEKILSMHKSGKSNTEIARELRLGIGEVKLVIDLFEQA